MKWTIGTKITAGFGLALAILALIGGTSYWCTNKLVDTSSWVTHTYQVITLLEDALSGIKDGETRTRGYVLTGDKSYVQPFAEGNAKVIKDIAEIKIETEDNPIQQSNVGNLSNLVQQKIAVLQDTNTTRTDKGFAAAVAVVKTNRSENLMDGIRKLVAAMEDEEYGKLKVRDEDAKGAAATTKSVVMFGTLGALVLLALVAYLIHRSITRPIATFMRFVDGVGQGDLRHQAEVTTSDEVGMLGRTLNKMVVGLRDVASQTRGSMENLNSASAEILASTQEQAASTAEQAAAVQQTTATMEEISQSGAQITEKARRVAASAEATSTASAAGLQAVQATTQTMEAIREQAEAVAENVVALSEKTQAVGDIIATVNDIAEQSNLLALNAAIEAAAAGDQGSRFSVVANEMKNLADQSKEATVQVRLILGDIQKGINTSVMLTEEAVKRVDTGKQQADVSERTIRQMADNILDSIQTFQQILAATNQQQIGFEQVTLAVQNIRVASEQMSTGTRQLEMAASSLNVLGQQLRSAVERYQV